MTNVLTAIKSSIRKAVAAIARQLDGLTGGRLTPDMVTYAGLVMHIPIALLIATGYHLWAAVLLVFFGLFDTLDGELARYQKRSGARGMLLDASTDRFKEVILYSGVAYVLTQTETPATATWAAAAVGASICVSYVKAKGEAVVASGKPIAHSTLNAMFADGLLSFELRITVLVAGLLFSQLLWAVAAIAVFASLTAIQRLITISRQL